MSTGLKAVCNREGLLSALVAAKAVVPNRPVKPVLRNLRIDLAAEGPSEVVATDTEVGLRRRILGAKVDRPGSVLIEAARAVDVFRSLPDEEVLVEVDDADESLTIRGMQARFTLRTEDVTLFPEVPAFDLVDYFEWRSALVRRAIVRTMFATDVESTRYALGGCLLEHWPQRSQLSLVGTDGRRMALAKEHVEVHGAPEVRPSTVLPLKAMKLLLQGLDDEGPPVQLAHAGNGMIFRTEFSVLSTRLVEGRYPRYQLSLPEKFERAVGVECGAFRRAVEQAAIGTSEDSRGVEFDFDTEQLRLSAQSEGFGMSRVEFPLSEPGPATTMTFDPSYLLAMLKVMPPDVALRFHLGGPKGASKLTTEDGCYTYVVMPLTRDPVPAAEQPKKGKKAKDAAAAAE